MLIDSETVNVEVFAVNPNGHWEQREFKGINDVIEISHIAMPLSMEEIYSGTKLL